MAKKNGNGLPTELETAFADDSGIGFEEVTTSDLQIPFLRLVQTTSPQLKKSDASYIKDASGGDIFNTVTLQSWGGDDGVMVLPIFFQMKLLEFIPRTEGGGFVRELSVDSQEVRRAVRDQKTGLELLENGNEVVRSAQHYVKIVHDDGNLENAIVDMKKTQLKKSRAWLSLMMMQKHNGKSLPMFATTYRLKSVEESNDKGDWYNWIVAQEGRVPSIDAYNDAKEMHGSISRGELQIAPPVVQDLVEDQTTDDTIPF